MKYGIRIHEPGNRSQRATPSAVNSLSHFLLPPVGLILLQVATPNTLDALVASAQHLPEQIANQFRDYA